MTGLPAPFVHPDADVAEAATLGAGTKVWARAQLMPGVAVGAECVIAVGVSLGSGTRVGDRVKIQTGCGVFGATLEDGVLLAPLVLLLEDPAPRAITADGALKTASDWQHQPATVRRGASVGAGSVILPGVVVGAFAMVCAGSVVARQVPDHAMVAGNPARHIGWACFCGMRLDDDLACPSCRRRFTRAGNAETISEVAKDHNPSA